MAYYLKRSIHLSCISSHIIQGSKHVINYKGRNKSWQDQTKIILHLIIKGKIDKQTSSIFIIQSKIISKTMHVHMNAYLTFTYLIASQHLCINGWTYKCMFMVLKQEIKKEILI